MSNNQNTQKGARIHAQLATIMAAVEAVGKSRRNQQQGFNFRGIEDIMDAMHPIFAEHKVFVLSNVVDQKTEERQTKSGGNLIYRILTVDVSFVSGEDGSRETVRVVGEGMDSGDKAANKAMSAALKYAITQTLILPFAQVDGDADSPPPSTPKAAAPATQANTAPDPAHRSAYDGRALKPGEDPRPTAAPSQFQVDEESVETCIQIIKETGKADIASFQRRMRIGYTNASKLMDILEERGIVGPAKGMEPRDVLIKIVPVTPPLAAKTDETAFHSRLYNAMTLCGITDEELKAYLVKKGIITAAVDIGNLPDRIVTPMLDGKDKKSGRNNWELITDAIKQAKGASK